MWFAETAEEEKGPVATQESERFIYGWELTWGMLVTYGD